MTWHLTDDVEQWLAAAADLLFHEPGVHTISLSVAANCRARPDGTRFAWWQEPGCDVTGAVSLTPPYPLLLAVVPDHAIRALVDVFAPTAVNGPTELAVQVAAMAAQASGTTAQVLHAERLFRLGELVVPEVQGHARPGTADDEALIVAWFEAFVAETGVPAHDVPASVRDRLSFGGFLLWEVDGVPVSLAGRTREAFGGVRIGPVYTPPEHRTRGYGGAVTAAVSALAQTLAHEVVLFTDLTNPTSNALYPRLGYRPVTDRAVLTIG